VKINRGKYLLGRAEMIDVDFRALTTGLQEGVERNSPQQTSHGDRLDAGIGLSALGGHADAKNLTFQHTLLNDVFAVVVIGAST
jgi:hypothetical protein